MSKNKAKNGIVSLVMMISIGTVVLILTLAILAAERNDDQLLLQLQTRQQLELNLQSCQLIYNNLTATKKPVPQTIVLSDTDNCTFKDGKITTERNQLLLSN